MTPEVDQRRLAALIPVGAELLAEAEAAEGRGLTTWVEHQFYCAHRELDRLGVPRDNPSYPGMKLSLPGRIRLAVADDASDGSGT